MPSWMERLVGPRLSSEELRRRKAEFVLPTLCFLVAALLLVISILTPYWRLELQAPQYPKGLEVKAYLNHLDGDVKEIDGLNHYIGMRPLGEAAQLEQSLSIIAVIAIALLVLGAIVIHNRNAALLALPALLFPVVFLADMYYWLHNFGTNLDPRAPLSSSIEPFVPPILGKGVVGQFATVALPDAGLILATLASLLILVGLYFHRQAYKPLVERRRRQRGSESAPEAGRENGSVA
ncbi:MAG: cytochrome C [Thermoanaerobaculia bacterium]|nr:cytochrome C [Thermoanaerobaculia bacterium]